VRTLGAEITAAFGEEEVTVIAIINGALLFAADLLREIHRPVRLDCIRVSSYRNETRSAGKPEIVHSVTIDIANRHVLLIDDILDTGQDALGCGQFDQEAQPGVREEPAFFWTRKAGGRWLLRRTSSASRFRTSSLLATDWISAERYRNLPCIGF